MNDECDTLETQREEFERHQMVLEFLRLANDWQRTYCRMVRALADEFGEELVLDTIERVWWDQAYEVGLGWRERFEADPVAALRDKANSWHEGALWARICCCDVEQTDDRWELRALKCYREVFNQMGEPKIGISWCMTDFAAVKGWGCRIAMRQRQLQHVAPMIEEDGSGHRHALSRQRRVKRIQAWFERVGVCYQPRDEQGKISGEEGGRAHCRADCQRQERSRRATGSRTGEPRPECGGDQCRQRAGLCRPGDPQRPADGRGDGRHRAPSSCRARIHARPRASSGPVACGRHTSRSA